MCCCDSYSCWECCTHRFELWLLGLVLFSVSEVRRRCWTVRLIVSSFQRCRRGMGSGLCESWLCFSWQKSQDNFYIPIFFYLFFSFGGTGIVNR